MVLYIVNVTIKKDRSNEWLEWMKNVHIPHVMETGYFINAEIYDIILPATHRDDFSYSIHFSSESYEKFMKYRVRESKRLQKEHEEKFGQYISIQRFVMEKV